MGMSLRLNACERERVREDHYLKCPLRISGITIVPFGKGRSFTKKYIP